MLVGHLRGRRRLVPGAYAISVVTRAELFAGSDDIEVVRHLLSPMEEIDIDTGIAEIAGGLRRSAGLELIDALIAATALSLDLALLTGNQRHFRVVDGLRLGPLGGVGS